MHTFLTRSRSSKKNSPRGLEAKTTRSKDGTWVKKGVKSFFGYKTHTLVDNEYGLIRETELITASSHDNKIDLCTDENQVIYKDKGYCGVKPMRT
ncbi:MAG: transposase IS4 [Methanobrevibacter sp. CfCl-M3]